MILPLQNKPRPVSRVRLTDPLAEGLVCASLMNEPGGASSNLKRSGLLVGTPAAGGMNTNITATHESWYNSFGSAYAFCLWHSGITLGSWEAIFSISDSTLAWQRYSSSSYFKNYHNGSGATMSNFLLSEIADPGFLVCLWGSNEFRAYVDGEQVGNVAMYAAPKTNSTTSALTIGGSCAVYQLLMYNRALSQTEIRRLYREPFGLFERAGFWPPVIATGGSAQYLMGSIVAIAALSATAEPVRTVSGLTNAGASLTVTLQSDRGISAACVAQANVTATLSKAGEVTLSGSVAAVPSVSASLAVSTPVAGGTEERDWMAGALFNGMTPSAHKLGTVLTGGWFWMHCSGCTAVYRGPTLDQVDFKNILSVSSQDVTEVSLPNRVSHEPNSSYCYVVRRFNSTGDVEQTDSAAVMARIDGDGSLTRGVPNAVFGLKVSQVCGNKSRLAWSYSPLDQGVPPEVFRVYWDAGTGQMNWTQSLAEVPYRGRRRYSYQSDALANGTYTFIVRACSSEQVEHMSFQSVRCSIKTLLPEAVTLLAAEAIP